MPHSGKHGLVPTFLRCVDAMKFKINLFFPLNDTFSQFKHFICHLCCILNKILKFETSTSLHSVFIHNLYSVPTFLESGLCIYIYIYIYILGMLNIYQTDKLLTVMGENDIICIAPINK